MKRILQYCLPVVLLITSLRAQDIHFSQFSEHIALINPALTGFEKGLRATMSYKNQWRSITTPYTTYGASVDSRLRPTGWKQVDKHRSMTYKQQSVGRVAAGLSVYKDKAGDGSLDHTLANLSLATFIATGKKSFLSVGLQGSYTQRKLNVPALVFPNQYNGTGYDPGVASNENFRGQNFSYTEVSAGMAWSYKDKQQLATHEKRKAIIGVAAYHLNQPRQKFLVESKDRLHIKYVLYGDFIFSTPDPRTVLAPKMLIQMQGSLFESVFGMTVKHSISEGGSKYTGIDKTTTIGGGISYRNNDAVILNFLLELKEQYAIGLSYDINVSRLAGVRGGTEIMLRYTPPGSYLYQMKRQGSTSIDRR